MIKQVNQSFELIPYTATYGEVTALVDDKALFEEQLKQQLLMEAEHLALESGEEFDRESFVPTLPKIKYVENLLTEVQQNRLTEISEYDTLTLDEVRAYVIDGEEPLKNVLYLTTKLSLAKDVEIENLRKQNFETMLALAEVYELLSPTE